MRLEFDDPDKLQIGGTASASMEVLEPSVIVTKKTLTPLNKNSFSEESPSVKQELPAMSSNYKRDKKFVSLSETWSKAIEKFMLANFPLALLLTHVLG